MKEHQTVYYIEEGHVYSGEVINIQEHESDFTFQIASYGACEGQYTIASSQIGRTVFYDEKEALAHI